MTDSRAAIPGRFVARPNRFLVVAELADGRQVQAYLPNTGRLVHLMEPGRSLILRPERAPHRKTQYTTTRAWDGVWVALEASLAPRLLTQWLERGHPLGEFGPASAFQSEVATEGHRLDLVVTTPSGSVWVEVKSGGRTVDGTALLSKTPSTRGVSHLAALAGLVAGGEMAAAAFVVQRPDARHLLIGGDADPGWVEAVRSARRDGVAILAYGCHVDETAVHIDRELPVAWD